MLILHINTLFNKADMYIYIDNMIDADDAHGYVLPYVMQLYMPRTHSYSA